MSIIYDALKKVESKNKDNLPIRNRKNTFVLVLSLIGVILIFILGSQYFKKRTVLTSSKIAKIKEIPSKKIKEEALKGLPSATDLATGKEASNLDKEWSVNYILEGIIYDQEAPLAVINGKILRKKDRIDDLEVINITPTSVELLNLKDNATVALAL
jgi:hypothetical protein